MLVHVTEPIVCIERLLTTGEGLGLICEELVQSGKVRLIMKIPLMTLLSLLSFLQQPEQHLSVGIGCGHHSLPSFWRRRWWGWWRVRLLPITTLIPTSCWSHPEDGQEYQHTIDKDDWNKLNQMAWKKLQWDIINCIQTANSENIFCRIVITSLDHEATWNNTTSIELRLLGTNVQPYICRKMILRTTRIPT